MVVGGLLILLILILLFGLLFSPIRLQIDTRQDLYTAYWYGIARVRLISNADRIWLRLKVFFWQKDIALFPGEKTPEEGGKKPQKPSQKTASGRKSSSFDWKHKLPRLLRSFQIRELRLKLDTGDYVINSYLYPLFFFASKAEKQLMINFDGEAEMRLVVENRPYRILRAYWF